MGHDNLITDLIMIPKLQFLASCSLDRKVILWDTISGRRRRTYTAHTLGVLTLSFNEEHILLFSGGFDHNIKGYSCGTLIREKEIHNFTQHTAPIAQISTVEHSHQMISVDQDNNAKVWDLRSFSCV